MGIFGLEEGVFMTTHTGEALASPDNAGDVASIVAVDARRLGRSCVAQVLAREFPGHRILEADSADAFARSGFGRVDLVVFWVRSDLHPDEAITGELQKIRRFHPEARIALVCDDEELSLRHMTQRGCGGYLPTSLPLNIAVAALRLVMVGGVYLPQPDQPCQAPEKLFKLEQPPSANDGATAERSTEAPPDCRSLDGRSTDRRPSCSRMPAQPPAALSDAVAQDMLRAAASPDVEPDNRLTSDFTPRERDVIEALRRGRSNKVIAHDLRLSENTVKVHVRHIMRKLRASNRTQAALRSQLIFFDAGVLN
jgi:DNA-binding NarL/FixJ family response regulator